MDQQTFSIPFQDLALDISTVIKHSGDEWIVCLHGIQSYKSLFSDFFNQPFLRNYSLLGIDLVGFGNSSKPENFSYDIADQAKIVGQIAKGLNIEKLHVIGHSLGGTVGTHMLKPLEHVIQSFINLEGNLTLADSSLTKEVVTYTFEEFRDEKYAQIKEKVKNSGEVSANLRSKGLDLIPDYAFYKTSHSIINWVKNDDLLHLFTSAHCKRLYIYGDQTAFKKDIAPDSAQKVEIPNSGHFMILDNPQATYHAIEEFLQNRN